MEAPSSTGRLEAFSDGVFAVAITLLIVDLHVPAAGEAQDPRLTAAAALTGRLLHLWPNLLAYFMSFVVVLVIWVNHHRVFTIVRRTDHAFLFWNGLLLMLVTFVPFPTRLLAEYMPGAPGELRVAAAVYAGNGFLIALAFRAMWVHAIRGGRLLPDNYDATYIKQVDDEYRWGPAAYSVVFLIAFVVPWASIGLCLALVLAFSFRGFMSKRPIRRRAK